MSSKLMKIATTANSTYTKINTFQAKFQKKTFQGAKSIDGLNAKLQKLSTQRGTATSVRDIRKLNGEINKTKRSLTKLENLPPSSFLTRINKARKGLGGMATAAIAGVGVMGAYNGFKRLFNHGADLEESRIKLEVYLGSMSKANKMVDDINSFANVTPFANSDIQKQAETLLGFGVAGNKIMPTLKMLGAVSGGNKDRFRAMSLAYSQMSSTGRLMGQDLLQMINAGFNPLQTISEKTGKSMAFLKKEMERGRISASMVESAFVTATSKGGRFDGMLAKMSKTSKGLQSTLFGMLQTKLAIFSEKYFLPFINKTIRFGLKLVENFEKIEQPILRFFRAFSPITSALSGLLAGMLGVTKGGSAAATIVDYLATGLNWLSFVIELTANGIGSVISILEPLAPLLKYVAFGVGIWKIVQIGLNAVLWANPIMLVVGGVVLLIGAVVTAYKKIDWFRGGILAIWETLKGFAGAIKDLVIERIKEMLSGIVGIGSTLMHFFKGDWQKAWETGKQATKDLLGVGTARSAVKKAKKIGEDAAKAYQKGMSKVKGSKAAGILDSLKPKSTVSGLNINPQAGLTGDGSVQNGIDKINGGGSKQTNIQVQFERLVENIIIKSETVEQGVDDMVEDLKEGLVGVLNSVNQLQTS